MPKKYCVNMKINIIRLLLMTTILFADVMLGQDIKITYGGESANGGILFSLSRLDVDGRVITKTEAIFSSASIIKDSLRQNIIASIDVVGQNPDKSIKFIDQLWLCLNDGFRVIFYYPIGTKAACGLKDGVSIFSYDRNFDIIGAVDSIGNIIMQPQYEYITNNGILLNGINIIKDESSEIVFQCKVFKRGDSEPDYTYDVIFDKKVPIYVTVHNEYSYLIDTRSFPAMLQDVEYDNDARLYLSGIHEMLNMNYETALSYFNQIANRVSFMYLERNIKVCEELITGMATIYIRRVS